MNPDLSSLHNYIAAHRQAGATDEAIYRSLIEAGWPDNIVHQALIATAAPVNPVAPPPAQQLQPLGVNAPSETGVFKGRIGRLGYVMASVYLLAYLFVAVGIAVVGHGARFTNILGLLLGLVGVLVAIPLGVSLHIRRWHDLGQSGWLTLLNLVPGVNFIVAVILAFVPGTAGPNAYGSAHSADLSPKAVFGLSK